MRFYSSWVIKYQFGGTANFLIFISVYRQFLFWHKCIGLGDWVFWDNAAFSFRVRGGSVGSSIAFTQRISRLKVSSSFTPFVLRETLKQLHYLLAHTHIVFCLSTFWTREEMEMIMMLGFHYSTMKGFYSSGSWTSLIATTTHKIWRKNPCHYEPLAVLIFRRGAFSTHTSLQN